MVFSMTHYCGKFSNIFIGDVDEGIEASSGSLQMTQSWEGVLICLRDQQRDAEGCGSSALMGEVKFYEMQQSQGGSCTWVAKPPI